MPTRFVLALFATVAAGGLLLAGCNLGSSGSGEGVEVTQRVKRGVTPGQRTFVIDSYNGDVTLQDTSSQEADLTFIKHARAGSREQARQLLDQIRIEERGGEGEFAYKLASGAAGRTSVDVQGRLPQSTQLRLHLQRGDVALSGLRGPLDVNNENGDIRIGGVARATRAETRNGSIEVGMRRVPSEAEVRLRTANGDLQLTLPASASVDVEARTEAGEIDTGNFNFEEQELNRNGAGARFEAEQGGGEAAVRLRTENGDITVRRGTVRRLPSVEADTTQAAPRDTTRRDTTGIDSLFAPPVRQGHRTPSPDTTAPDTAGLLGPPPRQQQARQRPVPYTDAPPPLLRRPPSQNDTSTSPAQGPGLPPLRQDASQRR